jgi:hypothetical protein
MPDIIPMLRAEHPGAEFLRRRLADALVRGDWTTAKRLTRWLDWVLNGPRPAPSLRRA